MSAPLWVAIALGLNLFLFKPGLGNASVEVDFTRPDLADQPVHLSDYRSQWVVVNFWATWCGPCIRELPLLQAFHDERDDVTVIGVNFETIDRELLSRFVSDMKITFPVVIVGDQPLLPFEPLKGLPSTFVVSPRGLFVAGKAGEIDRQWLESNTLLNNTPE